MFNKWIDTLLEEKEIDREEQLEIIGSNGQWNLIPIGIIVDEIKKAPKNEQKSIKETLVKIDFMNGNIKDFIKHLGQAIV